MAAHARNLSAGKLAAPAKRVATERSSASGAGTGTMVEASAEGTFSRRAASLGAHALRAQEEITLEITIYFAIYVGRLASGTSSSMFKMILK